MPEVSPSLSSVPARERIANAAFDRRFPRGERSEARAVLPPELDFIAGEGVSPQSILAVLGTAPLGVHPLDALLNEGMFSEEAYYRALARHVGCEYYRGDPPFAPHFDAVRGLKSGVAPLSVHGRGARAVIAPGARSISPLIQMISGGRLHPRSFALVSPQRFAAFVRMQRGEAILGDALGRLPPVLSAKGGMSGAQIIATAGIAASMLAVGAESFDLLTICLSAGAWLVFLTSIVLRSTAAVANGATARSRLLSDDEAPVYTIVVPLYRESEVVEDLVRASKLDIKL